LGNSGITPPAPLIKGGAGDLIRLIMDITNQVKEITMRDYVQIFQGLLTPLIALLALYIAWQQYQVNHYSLKNQLYERRFKVFRVFMSYLADIMREGKTSYHRVVQFYAEASEVEFLFNDGIPNKLEELYKKGIKLARLQDKLYPSDGSQGLPKGDERNRVVEEKHDLLEWFESQIKETKDLFKQQMKMMK
jgi:hypothetical protein